MNLPKKTEAELVEGCKKQDSLLQREFFDRYAGKMMGVCRRYTASRMDAEDMLQDGFVKVFERIDQFNGTSVEAWMRSVFVNLCLSNWRKNRRVFQVSDEILEKEPGVVEDGLQNLQTEDLLKLIGELPEGARVIFNLFAIEGFPHTEIALMLEITESASRAQLTRARQLLQRKLLHPLNN